MAIDGEWVAETVVKRYQDHNVSSTQENRPEPLEIKPETQIKT